MYKEEGIKQLNIKETVVANLGNVLYIAMELYIFFTGIKIVSNIDSVELKLFGLFVMLMMIFKFIRVPFTTVYDSKDGGKIRYD